ncbi:hypothetical protein F7725_026173 [Dissostichus mawsoni]|uniref:Uncharacterized protein n=1 Tax=Dissostichus mawsoni TaxID=36200 RepID=A0A7J5X7T6_DISMA|nr:hypothetical protein F7725_026173 [Dissostichus mawsoni]
MSPSSPCQMPPRGEGCFKTAPVSPAPPVPPRRVRGSGRTRRVKCVLVGDGAVGKTSLVVSYTTNGYPTEYVPTAFDNFSAASSVLHQCRCVPAVFSVVSPASFQNIPEKWISEIRRHAPFVPIVLVGTQCDLREDVKVLIDLAKYRERPVDPADAQECAMDIGAVAYMECSSLTQKNLKEVFDTAILASLQNCSSNKKASQREAETTEKAKADTGQDEESVQVLVEKVLLCGLDRRVKILCY